MITQTLAILLDAYRELQAKKMFWIVMILNIVVILLFGMLGVKNNTFTFLWYASPNVSNALYTYKTIFSRGILGFWFTWIAVILALISTAGVFPDFLSSGSVDLFIARPVGRLRLFLTKYLAGMLFVSLQISVFALLSFLALGIRASLWQPGIFLAIPLVLLLFSYLYGILVFFGVVTRSTVAALFLTLLAWALIGGVNTIDSQLIQMRLAYEQVSSQAEAGIDAIDQQIKDVQSRIPAATRPDAPPAPSDLQAQLNQLQIQRRTLEEERTQATWSPTAAGFETTLYAVKTVLPKTRETTNLMDRSLFSDDELKQVAAAEQTSLPQASATQARPFRGGRARAGATEARVELERHRPLWWVIGTSLIFEAVFVVLAAWYFCTRDF